MFNKILSTLILCASICLAQNHPVTLFVSPQFNYSNQEIISRMSSYIADMNKIYAKSTVHRFYLSGQVYRTVEPQTGSTPPGGYSADPNFPVYFSIIPLPAWQQSSGYPAYNSDGSCVIASLTFRDIYNVYDPSFVNSYQKNYDYCLQLHILVHEFAHFMGVAIGEYYKLYNIQDQTGIYPVLPTINVWDNNDIFWHSRPDYIPDPMLTFGFSFNFVQSRKDYTDFVQFGQLSSLIINRSLRFPTYPVPTTQFIEIQAVRNNIPVKNARVRIYLNNVLTYSALTHINGAVIVNNFLHGNDGGQIAIVKVEHGFVPTGAAWISHWDCQKAAMLGFNKISYRINL